MTECAGGRHEQPQPDFLGNNRHQQAEASRLKKSNMSDHGDDLDPAAAAAGSRSSPWSDIFDFFSLDASACWWRLFPKKSGCGCSCRPPAHSVMVVVPEEIKIPESEVEERSRGWV